MSAWPREVSWKLRAAHVAVWVNTGLWVGIIAFGFLDGVGLSPGERLRGAFTFGLIAGLYGVWRVLPEPEDDA